MNKAIILTGVATIFISGIVSVNVAKADHSNTSRYQNSPQHNRHYSRHDGHYDSLTRRERRRHNQHHYGNSHHGGRAHNNHYYGGSISFSSGRRHGRHRSDNLALGVGLGMLTYHIVNQQPRHRHTHAAPPPHSQPIVYVERRPTQTACLQTREYQTTVIIGGVERDAYGTACLQPDGSWKQGPATVEPIYNR